MIKNILSITLLLLLISCQKNTSPPDIPGRWGLSSIVAEFPIDIDGDGTLSRDVMSGMSDCYSLVYDFRENGSFITTVTSENASGVCNSDNTTGTWSVVGDSIQMSSGDFSKKYKFKFQGQSLIFVDAFYFTENDKTLWCDMEFTRL